MKKLIIIITLLGCLSATYATRTIVIKIGKTITTYHVTDYGESNYWGRNVVIEKEDICLPDDTYYEDLNIPKKEWECFSQNNSGIYDTHLESIKKEKAELRTEYNLLYAKKSHQEKLINILKISLVVSILIIIFLGLKILRTDFQKKLESARM